MSYETFTTSQPPQTTSDQGLKFKTLTAGFGDNYSQSVNDGLNYAQDVWDLEWILPVAEVVEKRAFLKEKGESTPFWWTPPHSDTPILVKNSGGPKRGFPLPNRNTLRATFVEAFEL